MNEPREIGNYEIVPCIDGGVNIIKDGQETKHFLSTEQAESWVLTKLNQTTGWCLSGLVEQDGGREQTIEP